MSHGNTYVPAPDDDDAPSVDEAVLAEHYRNLPMREELERRVNDAHFRYMFALARLAVLDGNGSVSLSILSRRDNVSMSTTAARWLARKWVSPPDDGPLPSFPSRATREEIAAEFERLVAPESEST